MKYESAVKLSSSANEMVRDVVVEEVTDTLSPSGCRQECIIYVASHIEPHTNLQLL